MRTWETRRVQSKPRSGGSADSSNTGKVIKANGLKFAIKFIFHLIMAVSVFSPTAPAYAQGEDPAALVQAGDLLLSQNDFGNAENAYNRAIASDPRYAPAYAHRCYLRLFQDLIEEAITDCEKAVEIDPQDAEGFLYLTRAYDWSGAYEKAVEAGKRAITLAPENGLAHSFLGEAYLDLDRLEEGGREVHLGVKLAPDAAEVHRNLAYWYGLIEQSENQLAELETARRLAPEFTDYLVEIAAVYQSMEDYQKALDYYLPALQIQQKHDDLAGEARTLNRIGTSYLRLGQYEPALDFYEQMLAIMQELSNRAGEGAAFSNMAAAHYALGQYRQALDNYQQALEIWQEIGQRQRECSTFQAMAVVHQALGQTTEALEYYQRALTVSREISDIEVEVSLLNRIAGFYVQQIGRYDLALDFFLEELVIREQLGDQVRLELTLENLGLVYFNLGQYQQALHYYQQALTIAEDMKDPVSVHEILQKMGFVYLNLAQDDQALKYFQQSLDIRRELGDEPAEAAVLNSMAMVYLGQEQYQLALENAEEALRLFEESGYTGDTVAPMIHIGSAYQGLGQHELARKYLERGLMMARKIEDPYLEAGALSNLGQHYHKLKQYGVALEYFQQTLSLVQLAGIREVEVSILIYIGEVYEDQRDTVQALAFYTKALGLLESVRNDLRIDAFKTSFSGKYADVYERLILLLWAEGRTQEAFTYMERARARAFLDQLAEGSIDYRSGSSATLLEREQELKTEISALRSQLIALRDRPQDEWDSDAIAAAQASLASREADYAQLLNEIKIQSPEASSLVSVDVTALAEIQALLDPETTLVEYFVTADRTLAFMITRDMFETFAVEVSRDDLAQTIMSFRDFASLDDRHPASLQQLYTWLIAPIRDKLKTVSLGIIPHGVMHYLPFAALTDGERYLSEDHILFTLPSASVLRFIQEKRKAEVNTILALGNPATDLPGLRFAEQEAQTIASLYSAQVLVGKEATETTVRSQASEAGILHLAAHGEYNPYNPLFSTIYLASDSQNDGRLEVHEVYSLDLTKSTDLVVLSACETNVGALSAGDEIVGLNRAFIYAGTPTVIASLWNVDDAATTLLMEQFYIHLREGRSKAEALRQAQMEVREQYHHPYYWAAFVLTGDPGADMQSGSTFSGSRVLAWTGTALLCALISILVIFSVSKVIRNRRLRGRPG